MNAPVQTLSAPGWSSSTADTASHEARWPGLLASGMLAWAYALFCVISLIPFLAVAYPPIVDLANHAARLNIACNPGDPNVAAMYSYRFGIIPDLAIDVLQRPLCGMVEPTLLIRLVTAASLVLVYASGWLAQRKLFGRPNAFLLLLPAAALNLVTTMGYVNFLAGTAIVCLMAALAIGRERNFRALMVLCNGGGVVVFFCHLFALAAAVLFFFGVLLRGDRLSVRSVAIAGLKTVALFAVPLLLILAIPGDHQPLVISDAGKLRVLVALFLAQHASLGLLGVLLLGPLYLLVRDGIVRLDARYLLPVTVLALYILVVPSAIKDAVDVDSRMVIPLAYLAIPALAISRRKSQVTAGLTVLAAAAAVFQLWAMVTVWEPFSRQVEEFRAAARAMPAQATVLSVSHELGRRRIASSMAYTHLASYATIDSRIFNPLEFTGRGMQPLSVNARFAAFDTPVGQPFAPASVNRLAVPTAAEITKAHRYHAVYALAWPERFDYVIYYHFGAPENFNPRLLSVVRSGSFFSILKVRRPLG